VSSFAWLRMTIARTSALKQRYPAKADQPCRCLQLPEHVVDEFVDLVLIERVAVHRLLSDRAIRSRLVDCFTKSKTTVPSPKRIFS